VLRHDEFIYIEGVRPMRQMDPMRPMKLAAT